MNYYGKKVIYSPCELLKLWRPSLKSACSKLVFRSFFPWCHLPFWIVMGITAVLPVSDLPLLIIPTKDVLNYSTTKHYNRFHVVVFFYGSLSPVTRISSFKSSSPPVVGSLLSAIAGNKIKSNFTALENILTKQKSILHDENNIKRKPKTNSSLILR